MQLLDTWCIAAVDPGFWKGVHQRGWEHNPSEVQGQSSCKGSPTLPTGDLPEVGTFFKLYYTEALWKNATIFCELIIIDSSCIQWWEGWEGLPKSNKPPRSATVLYCWSCVFQQLVGTALAQGNNSLIKMLISILFFAFRHDSCLCWYYVLCKE